MTQSAVETIAERVAETAPGLAAAAKLEALGAYRQANADYRKRINDSHRWQAQSLGMPDPGDLPEEPMGNLIVTGDVYGSDAAQILAALGGQQPQAQASQPATPQTVTPAAGEAAQSSTLGNITKAAIVAAGLLGSGGLGALVPWLLGAYEKQAVTNVVQSATGRELGIEVVPGGAQK